MSGTDLTQEAAFLPHLMSRRRLIAVGSILALGLAVVLGKGLTGRATGDTEGGCGGSESEMISQITQGKGLQGNLDPAILFAGWDVIEREVRRIAAEADRARAAGATGHIFNLGHGVLPDTDPTVLTRVVELVHSL